MSSHPTSSSAQISGNSMETPGLCKIWFLAQSFSRNPCCLQTEGNYISPNKSWPDHFICETSAFLKTEWWLLVTNQNVTLNFCIKKENVVLRKASLTPQGGKQGGIWLLRLQFFLKREGASRGNVGCKTMETGQPSILLASLFLLNKKYLPDST